MQAHPEHFDGIIGHGDIVAFFRDAAAGGTLPHALLFTGPAQVGKKTIALRLAAALLGAAGDVSLHPDAVLVERQRDPKTGKLRAGIGIEQIRDACGRLAMSALGGGAKACVIDGADELAQDAASALLKTLEEPRGRTVIIAVAESESAVLPTIRSRCQHVAFRRVARADIAAGLASRGVPEAVATQAAVLADGRPGRALALASDPLILSSAVKARDVLFAFSSQPVLDRWRALDAVLPPKTPFNEAAVLAHAFLDDAIVLFREALLAAADPAAPVADTRCLAWSALGSRRVAAAIEEAAATKSLLDGNVNPRTALESFAGAM